MRGLILAAGVGRRLGATAADTAKVLLRFGGRTLLQRHIDAAASRR
jgi:choline kinase